MNYYWQTVCGEPWLRLVKDGWGYWNPTPQLALLCLNISKDRVPTWGNLRKTRCQRVKELLPLPWLSWACEHCRAGHSRSRAMWAETWGTKMGKGLLWLNLNNYQWNLDNQTSVCEYALENPSHTTHTKILWLSW